MNKKTLSIIGVIILVVIAFYGGMKYGESKTTQTTAVSGFSGRRGGSSQFGGTSTVGFGQGGSAISGQIIAKDSTSITVQLRNDGGSRIIFLPDSTQVMQTVNASTSALIVGSNVTIIGTTNMDGSVTAQMVQLRPEEESTSTSAN